MHLFRSDSKKNDYNVASDIERLSETPQLQHKKPIHFTTLVVILRFHNLGYGFLSKWSCVHDLLRGMIKISQSYDLNRNFHKLDSMHKFKLTITILWFLCFISCFLTLSNWLQDNDYSCWMINWKWMFFLYILDFYLQGF